MKNQNTLRGLKYGILAGFITTMVSDIASLIIFLGIGESFASFFALLGRSFLTLIKIDAVDPVWQGLTLHYLIGTFTGLGLGFLTQKWPRLRFTSYKKGILFSIIVTQIEGNVLFYLMSVIMDIPGSEMVMIYGLGFLLHLIWGTCLGTMITRSQRQRLPTSGYPLIPREPL